MIYPAGVAEQRHRTFGLLGTLLILFVVLPLTRYGSTPASLLGGFLFSAVILWGLWTVSEHRRQRTVGIVLMAPALLLTILHHVPPPSVAVEIAWIITNGVALGFLIAVMLRRLIRTERVTADTLSSAISGYFLLGILWAFFYGFIYELDANAFRGMTGRETQEFFYFSFVTLTTLGYGDIVPVSDTAETVAVLEAIVGQLYLAITIARLVGLHIASRQSG